MLLLEPAVVLMAVWNVSCNKSWPAYGAFVVVFGYDSQGIEPQQEGAPSSDVSQVFKRHAYMKTSANKQCVACLYTLAFR